MAVTTTTRLGITRWSAGDDEFGRSQMDASHAALEDKAAAFLQGTSRPTAGAAYAGTFFWNSSTLSFSYCDGTSWIDLVAGDGGWGSPTALEIGNSGSDGVATTASRADHKHGMPDSAAPVAVGTSTSAGVATTVSLSDHAHVIGVGAIDASNLFAAGVVDSAAIGAGEVGTTELEDDSVTSAKLGQGAVDETALGTGAVTSGKIGTGDVDSAAIGTGAVGSTELASGLWGATVDDIEPDQAGSAGVASSFSRSDHVHAVTAGTPVGIGTANAEGTSTSFARSDHVHAVTNAEDVFIKTGANNGTLTLTTSFASKLSETITLPTGWTSMRVIAWGNAQHVTQTGTGVQLEGYLAVGATSGTTAQSGATAVDASGLIQPTVEATVSASSLLDFQARITTGTTVGKYINYAWMAIRLS